MTSFPTTLPEIEKIISAYPALKEMRACYCGHSAQLDQNGISNFLGMAAGNKTLNQQLGKIVEQLSKTHSEGDPEFLFWQSLHKYSYKAPAPEQYHAIQALCSKEPLTLKEYGDLRRTASLYPMLVQFENLGFPPSFAQEYVKTAFTRYHTLEKQVLKARTDAMQPGDLLFNRSENDQKIKGKKADILDKIYSYFSPEDHACRVVHPKNLSTSHIQHQGHDHTSLDLDALMTGESYRLDVTKLVDPTMLAPGDESAALLMKCYHQAVSEVAHRYTQTPSAVNALAEDDYPLSVLPFTRNTAKKKDWDRVAEKFMEGEYAKSKDDPRSMLCSAFTARETVAVLKLTEQLYKEVMIEKSTFLNSEAEKHFKSAEEYQAKNQIDAASRFKEHGNQFIKEASQFQERSEAFSITIPFGAHQRLGRMNPHGLLTALQKSGALVPVERTDVEKKLFVEFSNTPSKPVEAILPQKQAGFLQGVASFFRRWFSKKTEEAVSMPEATPPVLEITSPYEKSTALAPATSDAVAEAKPIHLKDIQPHIEPTAIPYHPTKEDALPDRRQSIRKSGPAPDPSKTDGISV